MFFLLLYFNEILGIPCTDFLCFGINSKTTYMLNPKHWTLKNAVLAYVIKLNAEHNIYKLDILFTNINA